jgi:hypothetical protein
MRQLAQLLLQLLLWHAVRTPHCGHHTLPVWPLLLGGLPPAATLAAPSCVKVSSCGRHCIKVLCLLLACWGCRLGCCC